MSSDMSSDTSPVTSSVTSSDTSPVTSSDTSPVTRTRQCGQCGSTTHDRRTCPDPIQVERRRLNRITRAQRVQQLSTDNRNPYKIFNNNNYPVYVYWGHIGADTIKYIQYTSEFSDVTINALSTHRLVFIPTTEYAIPPGNGSSIRLSQCNYFIAGDFNLESFDPESRSIHLIKEYHRPKTDLEQWKECGLKSLFLLKELERMGAKNYDNLEPILDMVQDIKLPECNELDKEQAGIPSAFTNVT